MSSRGSRAENVVGQIDRSGLLGREVSVTSAFIALSFFLHSWGLFAGASPAAASSAGASVSFFSGSFSSSFCSLFSGRRGVISRLVAACRRLAEGTRERNTRPATLALDGIAQE